MANQPIQPALGSVYTIVARSPDGQLTPGWLGAGGGLVPVSALAPGANNQVLQTITGVVAWATALQLGTGPTTNAAVNVDASVFATHAFSGLNGGTAFRIDVVSAGPTNIYNGSANILALGANGLSKWNILPDAAGLASFESVETNAGIQAPTGRLDLQKASGGPVRLGATAGAGSLLELGREQPVYSASMTPAGTSNTIRITATTGAAFTVNAPTANPSQPGAFILMLIRNASGGALGAVTFNAIYKAQAFVAAANGFSSAAMFFWDGTNYVQVTAWSSTTPN